MAYATMARSVFHVFRTTRMRHLQRHTDVFHAHTRGSDDTCATTDYTSLVMFRARLERKCMKTFGNLDNFEIINPHQPMSSYFSPYHL